MSFEETLELPHFEKASLGKWGLQGYTYIELKRVEREILEDALKIS